MEIDVEADILPELCRQAHRGHILRVTEQRPMVTSKIAQTADGQAAGGEHDQRLAITGLAANLRTHVFRAMHDAIMVANRHGARRRPLMTVRPPGCTRQPLRVILDARLELPLRSRIVVSAREIPVLALCGEDASPERRDALLAQGVEIVPARSTPPAGSISARHCKFWRSAGSRGCFPKAARASQQA